MVLARDKKLPTKKVFDNFAPVVHIHITMSKELDMAAVENCVCFNLRWVARAVTQFYDVEMRRHGIRATQEIGRAARRERQNNSRDAVLLRIKPGQSRLVAR